MLQDLPEIDGVPVDCTEAPDSAAELARLMTDAYGSDLSMAAVGGATKLHVGNAPRSVRLALHTRRLRGVVEYEPDNMTISVQAGTPLGQVQSVLAGENQFLALDPPHPELATMGGLVATNASGPLRFRYGTIRDMLIGIKVTHPDGTQTRAGGKLVKNVAGYDMCKLYTGSLGTLGVFTELTFKVHPKSEAIATTVIAYSSLRAVLAATQALLRADLMPDAMEALNSTAYARLTGEAPGPAWLLLLRFGETDAAVRWQVDRLRTLVADTDGALRMVLDTEESDGFWQKAASARERGNNTAVWLKCSVLYHSVPEIESRMTQMGTRLRAQTLLYCHAGTYIVFGRYEWPDGTCDVRDLLREIAELRHYCISIGGHLVVEKIQPQLKRNFDVWGYEAPALELMRRIKKQFDPKGLLNPGRFVGGL